MLAGHEESGGSVVEENGEKFIALRHEFESAMNRHVGGVAKYRAAEGKTVKLPLRGPVGNTAREVPRSASSTYVGVRLRRKSWTKRTTFIRVQEQENRIFNSLHSGWRNVRQPYPIPLIASPR